MFLHIFWVLDNQLDIYMSYYIYWKCSNRTYLFEQKKNHHQQILLVWRKPHRRTGKHRNVIVIRVMNFYALFIIFKILFLSSKLKTTIMKNICKYKWKIYLRTIFYSQNKLYWPSLETEVVLILKRNISKYVSLKSHFRSVYQYPRSCRKVWCFWSHTAKSVVLLLAKLQ